MSNVNVEFENFMNEEANSMDLSSPVLETKYWVRPKLEEVLQGDLSEDKIFHAVGYSLTQWESLESNLITMYLVFCELDNASSYTAIRRSIGTMESSAGRRKAIIEAAKVYFGESEFKSGYAKPYKKFFEAHDEATKRRNEIAHGIAHSFTLNGDNKGGFLFPAQYNSGRNSIYMTSDATPGTPFMNETYRYTSKNIYEFGDKFGAFAHLAYDFIYAAKRINGTPRIQLAELLRNATDAKKNN